MADVVFAQRACPTVVVVSAMASTTRDLESMARLAQTGELAAARKAADAILDRHVAVVQEIALADAAAHGVRAALAEARAEVDGLLEGISITRQVTPRTLDTVLAIGESLALQLAAFVLATSGCSVALLDARRVIVTDDTFGSATPLLDQTSIRIEHDLRPLLAVNSVVVVQGFVGRTEQGVTTTMGKESSNLTAVLLAALLQAPMVRIYTNVAGVRSADPMVCSNTKPRISMSYAEARVAAIHGVKILYPTMIDPAERAGVAITITGMTASDEEATTIHANGGPCGPMVILQENTPGRCTVSCVFGDGITWIDAVQSVLTQCAPAWFDMAWSATDRIGTLTIPDAVAEHALRLVHQQCVP